MNDSRGSHPCFGRRLELPDVCLGTEDGCGLTSLVLGALLLGAQAVLPPPPGAHEIRLSAPGPGSTPSTLDESEPVR